MEQLLLTYDRRPILAEMQRRSNIDWGEPPHYNELYKKIRYSGIIHEGENAPRWVYEMKRELFKKGNNRWNSAGVPWSKPDTSHSLMRDLHLCIRENIPFKTKSIEYKPLDQWVYIYGNKALFYDLTIGGITCFTYSGVYNKVTSFILRKFGINVLLKNKKLVRKRGNSITLIEIDMVYEGLITIINSQLRDENRAAEIT